ncbi:hypothetical protein V6N13_018640 [Hibiscus sabdariffa]
MVVSLSRIGAVLNLLRNDSDVFNILESIPTNQNVHIYLADKADRGELFEDSSEAEDVEEESREDAKEHNATCNVKEANETIVEDANVEEPKTVEDTNVEEPEIVVEDVNMKLLLNMQMNMMKIIQYMMHMIQHQKNIVEEDAVEEDAYSNEVGGGNTIAGDVEPEMIEEKESEMNEEEEDDLGKDEVAHEDVSHRVVQNLEGLYV